MWNRKDSVALMQANDEHAPYGTATEPRLAAVPWTRPAPTLSQAVLRSVIGVAVAVPAVAFVMGLAPRAERTITLRELPANVFEGDVAIGRGRSLTVPTVIARATSERSRALVRAEPP